MVNNTLNKKIWENNFTLKPGVKEALLKIVDQFRKELDVPIDIVDVRIVGSNASYNYNEQSDLDLHLVINNETLPYFSEVLKLYYNSARNKFNRDFDITVKGLPIELSIEDITSNVASNGVYSLYTDKWIKFPEKIQFEVKDMTSTPQYKKLVKEIQSVLADPSSEKIKDMINRLYIIRKNSILTDGEYGDGNLLFKAIRNSGLLQELKDSLYKILSKELTFESLIEDMSIFEALEYSEV